MMRLPLHVKYEDGTGADVVASAPDLIAFERHFDKSMSVFSEQVRIEYMLWLTWTALKRKNIVSIDFDPWCDLVDSIEFGDLGESEVVPLESTQPTG